MAEDLSEPQSARSFQLLGLFFPAKTQGVFRSVHRLLWHSATKGEEGGLLSPDWLAQRREARKRVGRPHLGGSTAPLAPPSGPRTCPAACEVYQGPGPPPGKLHRNTGGTPAERPLTSGRAHSLLAGQTFTSQSKQPRIYVHIPQRNLSASPPANPYPMSGLSAPGSQGTLRHIRATLPVGPHTTHPQGFFSPPSFSRLLQAVQAGRASLPPPLRPAPF